MSGTEAEEMRAELAKLEAEVGTRESITHYVHFAVAGIVAFVFLGATVKLYRDSKGFPIWAVLANVVVVLSLAYSLRAYFRGRALLAKERERVKRFLELRQKLGLQDPTLELER